MILKGLGLSGVKAATAGCSFALAVATIRVFDAGPQTDALFVAQLIPLVYGRQIWTMLVYALLPCFFEQKDPLSRRTYSQEIFGLLLLVSVMISLGFYVSGNWLLRVMAVGFDPETFALCAQLFRVLLPCLPFLIGCGFLGASLVSEKKYVFQAVSRLGWRVCALLSLVTVGESKGIVMYATTLSCITCLQFTLLLGASIFYELPWKPKWPKFTPGSGYKTFQKAVLVGVAGLGFAMIGEAIDRSVLSTMPAGSVTLFGYASRIAAMVPNIIVSGLFIQLMPGSVKQMIRSKSYRGISRQTSHFAFHLGIFLSLFFLSVASLVSDFLGQLTKLSASEIEVFWSCLCIILLGLPARYATQFLNAGYRFERNLRMTVVIASVTLLLKVPLLWMLQRWGPAGIAAAGLIQIWFTCGWLWMISTDKSDHKKATLSVPNVQWLLLLNAAVLFLLPWSKWMMSPVLQISLKLVLSTVFICGYLYFSVPEVQKVLGKTTP